MKMKIRIRSLIPVCMALAVHTASAQVQPVDYVDMFMGNRGESNCVIGPQLPHGSVNPSPQTPCAGNFRIHEARRPYFSDKMIFIRFSSFSCNSSQK